MIRAVIDTVTTALAGVAPVKVMGPGGTPAPYITLWPNLGTDDPLERSICALVDEPTRARFQTTLVATTPAELVTLTEQVIARLTDHQAGGLRIRPDTEQHRAAVPGPDPTSPPVWFLPLQWEATQETPTR